MTRDLVPKWVDLLPHQSRNALCPPRPFCYYIPPGLRAHCAVAGPLAPEFLISRERYHGRKIAIGDEMFARNDSAGLRQRRRVLRHNARLVVTWRSPNGEEALARARCSRERLGR